MSKEILRIDFRTMNEFFTHRETFCDTRGKHADVLATLDGDFVRLNKREKVADEAKHLRPRGDNPDPLEPTILVPMTNVLCIRYAPSGTGQQQAKK